MGILYESENNIYPRYFLIDMRSLSKSFSITLSEGQINNLRGFIGEKISSMKKQEIKQYVLSKIGSEWQELHVGPMYEDWMGSPYDDKLLKNKVDTVSFDSSNPERCINGFVDLFEKDKCFLLSKKAIKSIRESQKYLSDIASTIFPEPGKTIADIEFKVYKISLKTEKVMRKFIIRDVNSNKEYEKIITKNVMVIEDARLVLIELKAFKHGVKLTPPQQLTLIESRKNKSFYYFIFNLKFSYAMEPEIAVFEMQDRLLKNRQEKKT
jgi:hypothetical protein